MAAFSGGHGCRNAKEPSAREAQLGIMGAEQSDGEVGVCITERSGKAAESGQFVKVSAR